MQMQFVVVPEWVEQAFKAAGKPLTGLLDTKTLTTTLSKHDVAFYLLTQDIIGKLFPNFEIGNGDGPSEQQLNYLSRFNYYNLCDGSKEKEQIELPFGLVYDIKTMLGEIEPRILLGQANQNTIDDKGEKPHGYSATDWVFESIVLQNNVIAIHPVLCNKAENYQDQLINSYSKLIHILCQYLPFEAVAKTAQFATYTYLIKVQEYDTVKVA